MSIRASFPAWKIFVFGVDVTNDVTVNVNNWTDDRTPNMSQLTLSNLDDRYITTGADIQAMYADIDGADLESFSVNGEGDVAFTTKLLEKSLVAKINSRLRASEGQIADELKIRVITAKASERVASVPFRELAAGLEMQKSSRAFALAEAQKGTTSVTKFAELTGTFLRFPFQVGQCIFHTGDPVTIFWRDPYDLNAWYFAARGKISDWGESVSPDGDRQVTLVIEDNLSILKKSRVSTNPAIADVNVVASKDFDELTRTWYKDNFSGLTLPEILFLMFFGSKRFAEGTAGQRSDVAPPKPYDQFHYGVNGASPMTVALDGTGVFNYQDSEICEYGLRTNYVTPLDALTNTGKQITYLDSLADWQDRVHHAVPTSSTEILKLCLPEKIAEVTQTLLALGDSSPDEFGQFSVSQEAVMRLIGENPHQFPVDFGRLMILLPASLGAGSNRDILLRDLVAGVATQTEFTNRLAIIFDICQRIDFSFYATPKGDVVCEFPLYSFSPDQFGATYGNLYSFSIADTIQPESNFSDEKVRTMFKCSPWAVRNVTSLGNQVELGQAPGTASIPALIPMFGLRLESADPYGYISTLEQARYYAELKLSQANAEAWTQTMQVVTRLGLGPNRPCYFEFRDFIATSRGCSEHIAWANSVSQTLKLNYRRGWSGMMTDTEPRQKVYESFGGRLSQPLDYALLFRESKHSSNTNTKEESHVPRRSPDRSLASAAEIKANEFQTRRVLMALVSRLNDKYRTSLAPDGSGLHSTGTRTVLGNRGVGGDPNSKHLNGQAVDIPVNPITGATNIKTGYGTFLTGDEIAATLEELRVEGKIAIERPIWRTTGHYNHVHFELDDNQDNLRSHPEEPHEHD